MCIKCEIHDCTIAVCRFLEDMGIVPEGYTAILNEDKKLRIDNQYYLKNREVAINHNKIAEFVFTIKNISIDLGNDKINEIREKLQDV